jgi:predicted nucleic acid-binding protein
LSANVFVLDNSVVMAWALGEESPVADRVMDLLGEGEARVPGVWPLEFANALVAAERRKRLTEADTVRVREIVSALPIHVVPETPDRVLTAILGLARAQALSVYDASYLDLAMREGLPLATLDGRLWDAARRCSVGLLMEA